MNLTRRSLLKAFAALGLTSALPNVIIPESSPDLGPLSGEEIRAFISLCHEGLRRGGYYVPAAVGPQDPCLPDPQWHGVSLPALDPAGCAAVRLFLETPL